MASFSLRGAMLLGSFVAALAVSAPALADLQKIRQSGTLKVAVYNGLPPFSDKSAGIDVDLAQALSKRLGLNLQLLPFDAGEEVNDDLRNMVWKGHYLGYGPADVLLHVPVDRRLMEDNPKVEIFAPYHRETVRLVRNVRRVPDFDGLDSLAGKKIGAEKVSIAAMVLLGADDGKYREDVKIYPSAIEALEKLKAGELDAVLANQSEIESVLKSDPQFRLHELAFPRLPRQGWVIGMAVKKDETELAKLLQAAVNDMNASGELAAIFGRYGVKVVKP
jgi:ABC-type amino acid transport substrate-binding protein